MRTYATKLPTISWRWAWAPSVNVSEPGSPPLPTSCFPTPGPLVLNNAHIEEQGLYPASQPGTRNAQTSLSPSGAACPTGLYALAPNRHQAAGRPGGWGNGQLNTLAFLLPGLFHSGVIAFYARTALFLREHESCALKCKKLHSFLEGDYYYFADCARHTYQRHQGRCVLQRPPSLAPITR